jgi:ABC-type sugar transport system permease subunit
MAAAPAQVSPLTDPSGGARGRLRRPRTPGRRWAGAALTGPAWILLAAVILAPLAVAIYTSVTNDSLAATGPARFVGAQNYRTQVFTGSFWQSLGVTVIIMAGSLLVQVPIGYLLARALLNPLRGKAAFRAAIALPMMLTPVAIGLMWRFLADPDLGVIRVIAAGLHVSSSPNLLGTPWEALTLIVAVNSWINIPFVTLVLLAGMISIDRELFEAAAVDGGGWLQVERRITMPMVAPALGACCVLRMAADYRMFDLVYTITQGGPGTATLNLSMLAYQQSMVDFEIGRACAIAVAMAILALPAYWLFAKVTRA